LSELNKGFFYFIDEVGRGCLAGPVVSVACSISFDSFSHLKALIFYLKQKLGVTDSKKISSLKRIEILKQLKIDFTKLGHHSIELPIPFKMDFYISQVEPSEIDRINILQATMKSMENAGSELIKINEERNPEEKMSHCFWIDGNKIPPITSKNNNKIKCTAVIQGDQKLTLIALSSIVAKEYRDHLMKQLDRRYPEYNFSSHKGYGTEIHRSMIAKHGPTLIHRLSFAGVKEYVSKSG